MKIFVAGANGAICQPLIALLVRQGHSVTGMSAPREAHTKTEESWSGSRRGQCIR